MVAPAVNHYGKLNWLAIGEQAGGNGGCTKYGGCSLPSFRQNLIFGHQNQDWTCASCVALSANLAFGEVANIASFARSTRETYFSTIHLFKLGCKQHFASFAVLPITLNSSVLILSLDL